MRFDTKEVKRLNVDFRNASPRVQFAARGVLRSGARSVARHLRVDAAGHRYLDALPGTVSSGQTGPLSFEIGFDKGGQGSLAHIIVYGSVNNAPVFSNLTALRRALPEIERDMADAGVKSFFGGAR